MHQKTKSVNRLPAGAFIYRAVGQLSTSRSVHIPCRRSTVYQPERSYTVPSVNRLLAAQRSLRKVGRLSPGVQRVKAVNADSRLTRKFCPTVQHFKTQLLQMKLPRIGFNQPSSYRSPGSLVAFDLIFRILLHRLAPQLEKVARLGVKLQTVLAVLPVTARTRSFDV